MIRFLVPGSFFEELVYREHESLTDQSSDQKRHFAEQLEPQRQLDCHGRTRRFFPIVLDQASVCYLLGQFPYYRDLWNENVASILASTLRRSREEERELYRFRRFLEVSDRLDRQIKKELESGEMHKV